MNVLEWSRHFRCFPGQGTLDVTGVVAATLEAGYRGPLSLEVFSDVVREADPARHRPRRDAVAGLPGGPARRHRRAGSRPHPTSVGPRRSWRSPARPRRTADLLESLGFARSPAGTAASRSPGGATATRTSSSTTARRPARPGHSASSPPGRRRRRARQGAAAGRRSTAPAAPARRTCPASPRPPGCTSSSAPRPASADDWQRDFEGAVRSASALGCSGSTTSRSPYPPTGCNEEVVLPAHALRPGARARSRSSWSRTAGCAAAPSARGPATCGWCSTSRRSAPAAHRAPASTRSRSAAPTCGPRCGRCARAGVALMPVPDNYYVDLDARFGLAPELLGRPARAPAALRPGRRRRAAARLHDRRWRPASTSSCSSGAAGTTATAPPAPTSGSRCSALADGRPRRSREGARRLSRSHTIRLHHRDPSPDQGGHGAAPASDSAARARAGTVGSRSRK